MPVAMAADAPMGPMDAARSMEVENWDAPAEHWPADPVGHPTHMSDTNYRARAEVQIGIQQQVARAGLELLVDAKGGRDTDADAGQAAGAGGPRLTLSFDDTLAGVGVGAVRIDQQVEGGQCDLLVNATGAPSRRGRVQASWRWSSATARCGPMRAATGQVLGATGATPALNRMAQGLAQGATCSSMRTPATSQGVRQARNRGRWRGLRRPRRVPTRALPGRGARRTLGQPSAASNRRAGCLTGRSISLSITTWS